jgi:hypothetical protein
MKSFALTVKAAGTSEVSVHFYQTTQRNSEKTATCNGNPLLQDYLTTFSQ